MKRYIYLSILGLTTGELLIFSGAILYGLGIHLINLLLIVFIVIFAGLNINYRNVLQGLTLVTLLRVINLSMPSFFTTVLLQYPLMYGVMFVPIYNVAKDSRLELGLNLKYLPLAIVIGIMMGGIEYRILEPMALIQNIEWTNIVLISIIMVAFIGTVEEMIFRPILQVRLGKVFGIGHGIILSGIIFGIMHSTYMLIDEILFATIFGIVLGYIYYRTRNVIVTILIHGIANIMLFGVLGLI